jgi:hypothetical protein
MKQLNSTLGLKKYSEIRIGTKEILPAPKKSASSMAKGKLYSSDRQLKKWSHIQRNMDMPFNQYGLPSVQSQTDIKLRDSKSFTNLRQNLDNVKGLNVN